MSTSPHSPTTSSQRDEFFMARALLQGGSLDATSGITEDSMRRLVLTVVPDISSSAASSALTIFGRFARNHPQGNLAVDDLREYLNAIGPLVEISAHDLCHSFVADTFTQVFRLLAEDGAETPGSGASGGQHAGAHNTNEVARMSVRKEDLREFLEGTSCADGRPLSATVDLTKFLQERGRRNDVYLDDFTALMMVALHNRPVDPNTLTSSIVERRRHRREGKKKAMEKIKAALDTHLEDGKLGAELRAAASPPRRRALSPYAFGSWKLNQGALHQLSADGAVVSPSSSGTAQPTTTAARQSPPIKLLSPAMQSSPAAYQPVVQIPSPRDRDPTTPSQTPSTKTAPIAMKPLAIPTSSSNHSGAPKTATPRGAVQKPIAQTSSGLDNFSFSDIPMIQVETQQQQPTTAAASSYDFSAHNAILDETFTLLDVTEGGSISLDAVYELCAAFPNPPQPNAIRRLFHLVDVNASNDIDREEFEQLCFLLQQKTSLTVTDMCKYYSTAMYRRLFELLDEDGDSDASVSREELRVLLEAISPILGATFSSNDVYRLTKEYETDQLNFPQFQNVVKQLIRGKSISKVVGAFEEVLRRRRLLKRQALEKFANAAPHHPPAGVGAKKVAPPPSGPPPPKVCHNCTIQARRIIELEDQLAAVTAQRDETEREMKVLRMGASSSSGVVGSSSGGAAASPMLRGTAVLQWFDAVASIAESGSTSATSTGGPDVNTIRRMTAMLPSLTPAGFELLDAFGGAYAASSNPMLQLAADTTLCPLSGDRTAWADCVFTPMCNEAAQRLRDTHALLTTRVLPLVGALAAAVHPVIFTLQGLVAETEVGDVVDAENIDALRPQLDILIASREALLREITSGSPQLAASLTQFQRARWEVGAVGLLQLTTSSSKVRGNTSRAHSSEAASNMSPGKSPRGAAHNTAPPPTAGAPASNGHHSTGVHKQLVEYHEGTCGVSSFVQLLLATATAPVDAEVISQRILQFHDVPIREDDVEVISGLYASFAAISKRLSDDGWVRAEHNARRALDHVKEMVCAAVQFAKKDKSVMANLLTDGEGTGRTPLLTSSFADPSLMSQMPPLPQRAPSPQLQQQQRGLSKAPRSQVPQHSASTSLQQLTSTSPPSQRARSTSLARSGAQASSSSPLSGAHLHNAQEVLMHSSSPRLRNRRERPVNIRQQLDKLLEEFLHAWRHRIPSNFDRTDPATNVFHFGVKKIELSAVDNFIVVKVGGGYLLLEEYCEKYAAVEIRRWNLHVGKSAAAAAGGPAYRRSVSPGIAGTFGLVYTASAAAAPTAAQHSSSSAVSRPISTPRTTTPMRSSATRPLTSRSPIA